MICFKKQQKQNKKHIEQKGWKSEMLPFAKPSGIIPQE